jgi:glycosyltransferase involved in cell wall biosynthesis
MKIIITIPAYNEADDIEKTIRDIRQVMGKTTYMYSIVVHDDGSTDETSAMARRAADHVYTKKQRSGLARTFQEEMDCCVQMEGDVIVHTDADGQYLAEYIPHLIEKVLEGYDLVVGSRFLNGINYGNSRMKAVGNMAFSRLMGAISGREITDVTSGLRAMNRKTAAAIKIRSNFTYTYDQYLQAADMKLNIIEVPIKGRRTRKSRLMKNVVDYTIRALWDILVNFKRK